MYSKESIIEDILLRFDIWKQEYNSYPIYLNPDQMLMLKETLHECIPDSL